MAAFIGDEVVDLVATSRCAIDPGDVFSCRFFKMGGDDIQVLLEKKGEEAQP